ncbi:hypothetical protein OV207_17315 [Corallococcus sp. BB11-1]|uniref:hypothetical protein n=1 Tax=Corallococcus sp. BB11-1 TaxID=2996783 RepID=UPI002271D78F|nr:hypothetical protein [Corallococcus sp. BB11-1]MCY1033221.1 hypothetical protein [Corallococcus sp. BB11-1]
MKDKRRFLPTNTGDSPWENPDYGPSGWATREAITQSWPVPLRLMEKLRERVVQQRLAGLHVPAGAEEGQPYTNADAHLGLLSFYRGTPPGSQN